MNLFSPNIPSFTSFYERGRFLLAWRISIAFTLVFSILAFIYSFSSSNAVVPVIVLLSITVFSSIYLKVTKKYKLIFWIYAFSGTIIVHFAMNYVLDFTHYVDFIWITASVLLAFIGLGRVFGLFFILLNCIGIGYFFWFTLNKHIEILQPRTNLELTGDFIEVLFSFFVIAYLLQQFVQFQVYSESELKSANTSLEMQNKLITMKNNENETLVKEIHHRVKNNLQIIISLLRMQSMELNSEEAKNHFSESINRIMAMSLIHQKLYSENELSKIDLKSYIDELVSEIIAVSLNKENVALMIDTNIKYMSLEMIVPFGLLLNELVSNSLKYAFTEKEEGIIKIEIKQSDSKYKLTYSDNGTWKEPSSQNINFGTELIQILTEQLGGKYNKTITDGTTYIFELDSDLIN